MNRTGLKPGGFVGSHFRADHGRVEVGGGRITEETIRVIARTIVKCAAMMRLDYPVDFAGDTAATVEAVRESAPAFKEKGVIVVTPGDDQHRQREQYTYKFGNKTMVQIPGPLHVDFDKGNVSNFYPAFVDLLLMGNSMCQVYGIGGFGSFASLLSYNASCFYTYKGCQGSKETDHLPEECCMNDMYDPHLELEMQQKKKRQQKGVGKGKRGNVERMQGARRLPYIVMDKRVPPATIVAGKDSRPGGRECHPRLHTILGRNGMLAGSKQH